MKPQFGAPLNQYVGPSMEETSFSVMLVAVRVDQMDLAVEAAVPPAVHADLKLGKGR
jgi:hypothetical protein